MINCLKKNLKAKFLDAISNIDEYCKLYLYTFQMTVMEFENDPDKC